MQSGDACACFVRVGRSRLGSILGSILGSLWEPGSALYSFWVALVAETGLQNEDEFLIEKTMKNGARKGRGNPTLWRAGGRGRAAGERVQMHLIDFHVKFPHGRPEVTAGS